MAIPNNKEAAEQWITNLQLIAKAEAKKATIAGWIEPIRMLVQSGKDELVTRGFADTVGGANLDVAQQVITEIEKANLK